MACSRPRWTPWHIAALLFVAAPGCLQLSIDRDPCQKDGCGFDDGTCGESSTLRFFDPALDPVLGEDSEFIGAVAAGARLALEVTDAGNRFDPVDVRIVTVQVRDGAEFDIEQQGPPIVLRTPEEGGEADLRVLLRSGIGDRLPLVAYPVVSSNLHWRAPDLAEVDGRFEPMPPVGLLVGGSLFASIDRRGERGQRLRGYGLAVWEVGEGMELRPINDYSDAVEVVGTATSDGRLEDTSTALSLAVPVRAGPDLPPFQLVNLFGDPLDGIKLYRDVLRRDVFVELRDGSGRVFVAAEAQALELGPAEGQPELVRVSDALGRDHVRVEATEVGVADYEVRYGDQVQLIEVVVSEERRPVPPGAPAQPG